MKYILTITLHLLSVIIFAQMSEKLNFQFTVNNNNQVVSNQTISIKINIIKDFNEDFPVYVETHMSHSNINGLVSIIIGDGTVISGDISKIHWASGNYLVKTEYDINGGNDYNIVEYNPILSVPYTFHAKTAEQTNSVLSQSHYIGEPYGGGIIFWLDETGEHGLIVSMVEFSSSWNNLVYAGASSYVDGKLNTQIIISQEGHENSAAFVCSNYTNQDYGTGIFNDWYLPSLWEILLLRTYFYEIQLTLRNMESSSIMPMNKDYYYSSTEKDWSEAFRISFATGYCEVVPKEYPFFVRPIRSF